MLEEFGDFWTLPGDLRCITTNGTLRNNGNAIMGKGVALQARKRYPDIEVRLGILLRYYGNHVFNLGDGLISFPTKNHWKDNSDIKLIARSAQELVFLIKNLDKNIPSRRVLMPRPGCGSGNLLWPDVKRVIQKILTDDRYIIISNIKNEMMIIDNQK